MTTLERRGVFECKIREYIGHITRSQLEYFRETVRHFGCFEFTTFHLLAFMIKILLRRRFKV